MGKKAKPKTSFRGISAIKKKKKEEWPRDAKKAG